MTALDRLAATIAARKGADPETSWTAKLLSKGPEKCAEKFGEEAIEAIIEAGVIRFRPIMLTSATTIVGTVVISSSSMMRGLVSAT